MRSCLALVLLLAACGDDETALDRACKTDDDCPRDEMKCVVAAGVCVGFSTPLDAPPDGGR